MDIALLSALVGSFCLGLMIVFDRLMMGDCYKNRPDNAWFISSTAGASFGLVATLFTWIGYSYLTDTNFSEILATMINLIWPHGLLMILVGVINIQVMRHYFRLFIPDKNEKVNETAVAMWLSSVPIFIFLTTYILSFIVSDYDFLSGLSHINITFAFGLSVTFAAAAMIGFEYHTGGGEAFRAERMSEITKMISCIVAYTLLSSALLRGEQESIIATLALQPFYWLGFAAGIRAMIPLTKRKIFSSDWSRIKQFLLPIIVVEIIGMSVYYFEFFALSGADPTLVNLITGAHIIPVFLLSLYLCSIRKKMEETQTEHQWMLGLSFTRDLLPDEKLSAAKVFWFTAVVLTLLLAIYYS
jgi:hypothetical protein